MSIIAENTPLIVSH